MELILLILTAILAATKIAYGAPCPTADFSCIASVASSDLAHVDPFTSATATPTLTAGQLVGYPYSTTWPNDRVVAYATTLNFGYAPVYTGSSTTVFGGKTIKATQASLSSANVGTLTGAPLYTAISNAIMSKCTTVPTDGPVTSCGNEIAAVDNIIYTDDVGDWYGDGKLEIAIPVITYCSISGLRDMVSSAAAIVNASSLTAGNKWQPEKHFCSQNPNIGCSLTGGEIYDGPIVNIPGFVDVLYERDMAGVDCPTQQLVLEFSDQYPGGNFKCSDIAVVFDSLAALAALPGLGELAFLAFPALGFSLGCVVSDNLGG